MSAVTERTNQAERPDKLEKSERAEKVEAAPPAPAEVSPAARLGQRLRQARLRRNMTQSEVAGSRFSVSYISAVERGQIRPSLGALEMLSSRLEVPLADLMRDAPLPSADTGAFASGHDAIMERRREEAEARLRLGQVMASQGKPQEALAALRQINPSYLSTGAALEARRLTVAALVALGQADEARRVALEGVTAAERAGDEEAVARLRNALGDAYLLSGKSQLALEQYRSAYEATEGQVARDPIFRLQTLYNLGAANARLGHTDDTIAALRQAAELAEELSQPDQLGAALWSLSVTYNSAGDTARARQYAQRSLAAYEQGERQRLTARIYTRLGRAAAQSGQTDEALAHLRMAQALAAGQADPRGAAEAASGLAAVFIAQGALDEAAGVAEDAAAQADAVGDSDLRAEARLTLASLREAQGQGDQARASYEEAIALLEGQAEGDAPLRLADAYASYSAFLERNGEGARAFDLLKQAWRLRESGAAH